MEHIGATMPWTADDAPSHTAAADTPEKRRQWAAVANRELAEHGDDARAIRAANAVVARRETRHNLRLI